MNCIACMEDLRSMGNGLLIYMMAPQRLVAKPHPATISFVTAKAPEPMLLREELVP